jgi:hypothetical protein
LYAAHSSYEELEEEDFMEGNYANDEVRSLEDIGDPQNVCTMFTHFQEAMRGRKGGEKRREGSVVFLWGRPRAHLFCKIPPLSLILEGILWRKKEKAMSNPLKVLGVILRWGFGARIRWF